MSGVNLILENYDGCYYPGSVVSGRVECYFTEEKKVRGIEVRYKGVEKTEWKERETYTVDGKTHTRYVTYTGEHHFFNSSIFLMKTSADHNIIPPGKHTLPFSFQLPHSLPSSYDDEYINIYYKVKVVIDRPWKFDYESQAFFKVVSPIDLNQMVNLREPITISDEKHLCCLWCASGPLTVHVTLPYTGFAPGESIPCRVRVENLSSSNVEAIKFKLKQENRYLAESPKTRHKEKESVIAVGSSSGVGAHGEHDFMVEIPIPEHTIIPNVRECTLIKVFYTFKVEAELPCPHVNLELRTSVTLGHIKLNAVGGLNGHQPNVPPPYSSADPQPGNTIGFLGQAQYPYNSASAPVENKSTPLMENNTAGSGNKEDWAFIEDENEKQVPGSSSYHQGGAGPSVAPFAPPPPYESVLVGPSSAPYPPTDVVNMPMPGSSQMVVPPPASAPLQMPMPRVPHLAFKE